MQRLINAAVVVAGIVLSGSLWAAPLAQSGPLKVALLEVYSSEGCSSCPPAEEWVSRLSHSSGLWSEFVPVVFHVDYWDSLGWKDTFAERQFSERQQAYAAAWGNNNVYTPGFVLNGKEWRDWYRHGSAGPASKEETGNLSIEKIAGGRFRLTFEPQGKPRPRSYVAHVALLGCGFVSDVKSGENTGRHLQHDFAVVAYAEEPMEPASDGSVTKDIVLASPRKLTPRQWAIAAWVSQGGRLEPLQAAGAYL